ncbi:hypothetical protein PM082_015119 [Marasmius tenuissimus]|nr:hypothetical protein PM082_015119 [Marasmius tenuissimus]
MSSTTPEMVVRPSALIHIPEELPARFDRVQTCGQVSLFSSVFLVLTTLFSVFVIYLLNFTQIILMHEFCWDVFVTGVGVKNGLPSPQAGTAVHTMLTGIVSATVQIFFAWRVYSLRKSSIVVKIAAILIVLLALEQCASCLTAVGLYLRAGNDAAGVELLRQGTKFDQAWLIGAVICDLIIAAAMTTILVQYSRESTVARTQTLVKSLIVRSVETGTITFVVQLINLILFVLYPTNFVYMIFDRSISSLYSNALLLSLNARQTGADIHTTNWANSTHPGSHDKNSYGLTVVSGLSSSRGTGSTVPVHPVHISKHTTTDTRIDSQVGIPALIQTRATLMLTTYFKYEISKASSNDVFRRV